MKNGRIAGTGSYVPETIWKNEDLEKMVETSDAWIRERTGIGARHIAGEETVAQMAVKAARRALENAGICSTELDLILVGTSSSESIFPNTACLVQDEIGAFRAACLDVSAACTGFLAVYELGQMYIRSGKAKNVLLIGADALSRLVDWHDRGTCILFGDGAGAIVLTAEEQETKACEKIHSDGEKGVSLTCEKGTYLQMDGRAVFQFALSRVPEVIREVLKEAEVPVEEIDAFILHQANSRIIDGVAKRLKAPKEKFPRNIEAYGNTCAASIPILLDEWNRSDMPISMASLALRQRIGLGPPAKSAKDGCLFTPGNCSRNCNGEQMKVIRYTMKTALICNCRMLIVWITRMSC